MLGRLKNYLFGSLPNDASKYYDGTGNFSVPVGSSSEWDASINKTVDNSVTNSDVLTDATELQFSTQAAGAVFLIEALIIYSANSTAADFKVAFAVAAGTMFGNLFAIHMNNTNTATSTPLGANDVAATVTAAGGTDASDTPRAMNILGIMRFSNNTTFKTQFAQNTATPATTSKLLIGSILRYKRLK